MRYEYTLALPIYYLELKAEKPKSSKYPKELQTIGHHRVLAGIESNVSPHSFRHGFIHRLALRGVPDSILSVLVGHSTPHTIAHYTKLCRTEYEQAFRSNLQAVAA